MIGSGQYSPTPIEAAFAVIAIIVLMTIKGFALWNAAHRKELLWFILLLVLNTFGILDLIYLAFVARMWKHHKPLFHRRKK